jgi:hypothetical protein
VAAVAVNVKLLETTVVLAVAVEMLGRDQLVAQAVLEIRQALRRHKAATAVAVETLVSAAVVEAAALLLLVAMAQTPTRLAAVTAAQAQRHQFLVAPLPTLAAVAALLEPELLEPAAPVAVVAALCITVAAESLRLKELPTPEAVAVVGQLAARLRLAQAKQAVPVS